MVTFDISVEYDSKGDFIRVVLLFANEWSQITQVFTAYFYGVYLPPPQNTNYRQINCLYEKPIAVLRYINIVSVKLACNSVSYSDYIGP